MKEIKLLNATAIIRNKREDLTLNIIVRNEQDIYRHMNTNTFEDIEKTRRICRMLVNDLESKLSVLFYMDILDDVNYKIAMENIEILRTFVATHE